MERARQNWGYADIFGNDRVREHVADDKPEQGGPVHRQLMEKKAAKMERRAKREQQRLAGGGRG